MRVVILGERGDSENSAPSREFRVMILSMWHGHPLCSSLRSPGKNHSLLRAREVMPSAQMSDDKLARHFGGFLRKAEVLIYYVLALLLTLTAAATVAGAVLALWNGLVHLTIATETLRVLRQLLVVFMLVELLHTDRISIRLHILLATEPFLVVGVIAPIRRVLVISLERSTQTQEGNYPNAGRPVT